MEELYVTQREKGMERKVRNRQVEINQRFIESPAEATHGINMPAA